MGNVDNDMHFRFKRKQGSSAISRFLPRNAPLMEISENNAFFPNFCDFLESDCYLTALPLYSGIGACGMIISPNTCILILVCLR